MEMKKTVLVIVVVVMSLLLCACGKSVDYNNANALMEAGNYQEAMDAFTQLGDYKDSLQQRDLAEQKLREFQEKQKRETAYANAETLVNAGQFREASRIFEDLGDYRDSQTRYMEASYANAEVLLNAGQYEAARLAFENLGEYQDSTERYKETFYREGFSLLEEYEDEAAYAAFLQAGDFMDTKAILEKFRNLVVSEEYSYGEGKGYVSYYAYTADGKIAACWSDEVGSRIEYYYDSDGVLTQAKKWNYNHIINGEPSYYLIDYDKNGIPIRYDDTGSDVVVEFSHTFAEDGSVQSITYQRAQYSGSNKTLINKQSATFTFAGKTEKYYVDKDSYGNYLNAFTDDSTYRRYAIYEANNAIGIYEVGTAELDEHGNFQKLSERGGIFNADGGWVNEYEYTNTYDEHGNLTKAVYVNTETGAEFQSIFNYGNVYPHADPLTESKKVTEETPKEDTNEHSNKHGAATTPCAYEGCVNYIAPTGDTNCCTVHSNKCQSCGCYIDDGATKCASCVKKSSDGKFTNKYGTPTTKCARSGCNEYIASSGDTNCCRTHSNRCGNCNCYIDGDAMYCMRCIKAALK